jgi:Na+/phosphate symporter
LIESNEEEKKEVYIKIVRECIDLINEKLIDSDLDAKDKLLRVKDKLLNDKQTVSEDFDKNLSKLIELRGNLQDN